MRLLTERKIVLASHNGGKIKEIEALLSPYGIESISAAVLGIPEPAETETTFTGNARIKAHNGAKSSGYPALADDSGIEVVALNGAPGVYTADWAEASKGRDFALAMTKVWNQLEKRAAPEPRLARFVCTLCLAWPDGQDAVFTGSVDGRIVWPMRGEFGFGFDPIFLPEGHSVTFAEMDPRHKAAISHRAAAFAAFLEIIPRHG